MYNNIVGIIIIGIPYSTRQIDLDCIFMPKAGEMISKKIAMRGTEEFGWYPS